MHIKPQSRAPLPQHRKQMVKASAANSRVFSWKEVAQHNKIDDAYISIDGKVYDITRWMDNHPGGRDALHISAGRDCSLVFKTYHGELAHKSLSKFEIGTLRDTELPEFARESQTAFYPTLKRRLDKYFQETKQNPKSNVWILLRYVLIVAMVLLCSYTWLVYREAGVLFGCVVSLVQGFACAMIGLMPLHDGSHFSVTKNPGVWQFCMHLHDFLNGASSLIWMYQHVLGHHPYTNIEGADPDIETVEHDVRRIKTSQPWYSHYLAQHIYAPLLYALLAWKTRTQDIRMLHIDKTNGSIRINTPSPRQLCLFWAGKAVWFTYRVLIPSFYMPIWRVLLYLTIADFVTSYWLALTFQANHVVEEVDFVTPDKDNKIKRDWAELQLSTTQDYAHASWFWTTFTGALNYQSTHHLVPGIHQYYYSQILPIIERTASEFGVKYLHKETFTEALGSHISFLHTMGQPQKQQETADKSE